MQKIRLLSFIIIYMTIISVQVFAQNLGIGPDTFDPDASAGVEMKFTNKGLLIPRVTLTSTTSTSPITTPVATSLLVYNTATTGDVTPGYYYWDGSQWVRFATGSSVINGSGVATRVAFWTAANTLGSNANLYWDNTNNRLGIGTTTPQTRLHVSGPTLFDDGFEDGSLSPFTTGGNANWAISTTSPYAGSYCAESGTITHSQSTYMELTQSITFPGQISFAIKISSESNYDKLSFYIDGTLMSSWSGEVAWTTVSYAVSSGSHTFKWEYSKDGSVNRGSDKVWIDEIKILYLSDLATIEGNTNIGGSTNIGGNAIVNGSVGLGTTNPSYKLHINGTSSENYLAYVYRSNNSYGPGKASIYGYRRGTSGDSCGGTGYTYNTTDDAILGYSWYGNNYTFGVHGCNWNDYNRSGGVLGAQWAGSYWGSLGYKNSGGTTYGGYWSSSGSGGGSGSGAGYSSTGGAMAGVGAGGYGDMLGLWSRGEVMGAIFSGELFSTYNLGNTYTSGTQVELVNVGSSKVPAYSVTAPEIKVYDNGFAQLNGNETKINFNQNFIYLLDDQKPVVTITPIGKSANLYIKSIDKDGFIVACDTPQDIQFTWIAVGTRIDNKEVQRVPEELTDINFDNNLVDFMFNENIKERSAKAMWWDGNKIQFGTLPDFFHQADREAKQAELEKMKQMEEKNNNINTEKKSE
jgi:hypothetical protein